MQIKNTSYITLVKILSHYWGILLNSKVFHFLILLQLINPTQKFQISSIHTLPLVRTPSHQQSSFYMFSIVLDQKAQLVAHLINSAPVNSPITPLFLWNFTWFIIWKTFFAEKKDKGQIFRVLAQGNLNSNISSDEKSLCSICYATPSWGNKRAAEHYKEGLFSICTA